MLWDDGGVPGTSHGDGASDILREELEKSVTVMMESSSTQHYQQTALNLCEEFRYLGPLWLEVG